jgi:SAM-dependent methyltransferase
MNCSQLQFSPRDIEAQRSRKLEEHIYWDSVARSPADPWKRIRKMFADPRYAQSVIRKHLRLVIPRREPLRTADRLILENVIFPHYLSQPHVRDVLFVGCDRDTARYARDYFSDIRFVTLEPDPEQRKFGAVHHVEAPLEELGQHFATDTFDLIICNGVFGWGLDAPAACESAFDQCHTRLRSGGQLLLGWNDLRNRVPVPLDKIASLRRFRRHVFPPFGTWRYLTDTPYRHTFDFYVK